MCPMKHALNGHPGVSAALVALGVYSAIALAGAGAVNPVSRVEITTLSTDASRITGGDVLVQVALPEATPTQGLRVSANGRDVTLADGRKFFMGSSGTGAPYDKPGVDQRQ